MWGIPMKSATGKHLNTFTVFTVDRNMINLITNENRCLYEMSFTSDGKLRES